MNKRGSGILCHITSLPNKYAMGEFGSECFQFIDWLKETNQKFWEVLPMSSLLGRSGSWGINPYVPTSSMAGNTNLISTEFLLRDGFIKKTKKCSSRLVEDLDAFKIALLEEAFKTNGQLVLASNEFKKFEKEHKFWLTDFAIFEVVTRYIAHNSNWVEWGAEIKNRNPIALKKVLREYPEQIAFSKFNQFLFFKQWNEVKQYANDSGIKIIGDIPIYVQPTSCDTWMAREQFRLNRDGTVKFNGGTPPDCFSKEGQNWSGPVYNWKQAKKDNFFWQTTRINHQLRLFDILRLDHFQGYIDYWEIPTGTPSSNGHWASVPSRELFTTLKKSMKSFNVVVEDLGARTKKADAIIKEFNLAGMNVLLYAFDSDNSIYLPFYHAENSVCYIGTHDNTTALGHYREMNKDELKRLENFLGKKIDAQNVHVDYMRLCLNSASKIALLQVQDVLGLDETARMNIPETGENWLFQLSSFKELKKQSALLKSLTRISSRDL